MKRKLEMIFMAVLGIVGVVLLRGEAVGGDSSGTPCPRIPGEPNCVCNSPYGVIDLTPLGYNNASAPM